MKEGLLRGLIRNDFQLALFSLMLRLIFTDSQSVILNTFSAQFSEALCSLFINGFKGDAGDDNGSS